MTKPNPFLVSRIPALKEKPITQSPIVLFLAVSELLAKERLGE